MVDGVHRPVVVVVVVVALLQFFRFLVCHHCTKETKYNAVWVDFVVVVAEIVQMIPACIYDHLLS
jgi:hypothetical protein